MKTIKVGKFPGRIEELVVEDGATVAQVLDIAGLEPQGYEIQLDGNVVGVDTVVDGNLLVLAKQVKGA